MLIAIMGDTFDRVIEMKEQLASKERMDILADYVQIFPKGSKKKNELFLFSVKPLDNDEVGARDWTGKVAQIRKSIMIMRNEITGQFEKQTKQ